MLCCAKGVGLFRKQPCLYADVTFPIGCPPPGIRLVRKSPPSRSMRWCYKSEIRIALLALLLLVLLLPSMSADFLLPGIAPGCAGVGYPLSPCFLDPGTHFILVLVEPVATKDLAPGERPRRRLHEPLPDPWIICALGMPPGCLQLVA